MRFIDAEAFLKTEIDRCGSTPLVGTCTSDNEYLSYILKKAPTIEAKPVVHGRWDDEHRCTVCHNEAFYKISNIRPVYDYDWEENLVKTGDYIWDTEWFETTYCPYCGAQMDEEADNG